MAPRMLEVLGRVVTAEEAALVARARAGSVAAGIQLAYLDCTVLPYPLLPLTTGSGIGGVISKSGPYYQPSYGPRSEKTAVSCPDEKCDGHTVHWQRSIRYRCTACERFFDFVLAPASLKTPKTVPARKDRVKR